MEYRHMELHSLHSIVQQYAARQSIKEITDQEGFDRKIARRYLTAIGEYRIRPDEKLPENNCFLEILHKKVYPSKNTITGEEEQWLSSSNG